LEDKYKDRLLKKQQIDANNAVANAVAEEREERKNLNKALIDDNNDKIEDT